MVEQRTPQLRDRVGCERPREIDALDLGAEGARNRNDAD